MLDADPSIERIKTWFSHVSENYSMLLPKMIPHLLSGLLELELFGWNTGIMIPDSIPLWWLYQACFIYFHLLFFLNKHAQKRTDHRKVASTKQPKKNENISLETKTVGAKQSVSSRKVISNLFKILTSGIFFHVN